MTELELLVEEAPVKLRFFVACGSAVDDSTVDELQYVIHIQSDQTNSIWHVVCLEKPEVVRNERMSAPFTKLELLVMEAPVKF